MTAGRIIYIISGILIAIVIIVGVVFWLPKYQEFVLVNERLKNLDSQIETKNQYLTKMEEASQKIDLYAEDMKKINSALPTDPDISIPPLVNYLIAVGFENGVELTQVGSGVTLTDNPTNGLSDYPIALGGTGSYDAVKNLLTALYNNSRIIDIDSISISGSDTDDKVSFTLNGKTYFYKQAAATPAVVQ